MCFGLELRTPHFGPGQNQQADDFVLRLARDRTLARSQIGEQRTA